MSDRYEIVRTLAQGAFGESFEAVEKVGKRRRVRLTRLSRKYSEQDIGRVKKVANLDHEALAKVVDYGELDGEVMVVEELAAGLHADDALRRSAHGKMPIDAALFVVSHVAAALAHIHSADSDVCHAAQNSIRPEQVHLGWHAGVTLVGVPSMFVAADDVPPPDDVARRDVVAAGQLLRTLVLGSPIDETRGWEGSIEGDGIPATVIRLLSDADHRLTAGQLAERSKALAGGHGQVALETWLESLRNADRPAAPLGDMFGAIVGLDPSADTPAVFTMTSDIVDAPTPSSAPSSPSAPRPSASQGEQSTDKIAKEPLPLGPIAVWAIAIVVAAAIIWLGRPVSPTPSPDANPPSVGPEESDGRAWLRVGGQTLFGSEVYIDAELKGHAPVETSLAHGNYRIVVRDPDGGSSVDETIVLGPEHTRSAAYRIVR